MKLRMSIMRMGKLTALHGAKADISEWVIQVCSLDPGGQS
jgi:hypothetical protein